MHRWFAVSVLCVVALCTVASAQEGEASSRVSIDVGVDVTNGYYFRGFLQEDHGFLAQPFADLTFRLFEDEGTFESVDLSFGMWNSFHSDNSGVTSDTAGDPDAWYRSDGNITLSFTVDDFEFGASWMVYSSPNGSFQTIQEWVLDVAWDDAEMWGDFGGVQPTLTLAIETNRQADGGRDMGRFLGLGIEPSIPVGDDMPFTLSLPVMLGLSLDGYYEDMDGDDNMFGFLKVGVALDMPLDSLSTKYGEWTLTAGCHALMLGDSTEEANDDDELEFLFNIGLFLTF